jgi:SAM-dependent methyltransferase
MAEYQGVDNLEQMASAVNYNGHLLESIMAAASGGKRACDFGAGTGFFAGKLQSSGWHISCVEPDAGLRAMIVAQGIEVVATTAELPDASQPFVYSLNVLEHIEDDRAALTELFRILQPGGRLYIYVPAMDVLFSSMDRKVSHFRRYSRGGLVDLVEAVGFDCKKAGYVDSLGFFATLLYKWFGSNKGDINGPLLRLYDSYLFPLSRLLDHLCHRWFGKNLSLVAQKP